VGNYVNNIESIDSPETYGLAKCEAYLNGKNMTCAKAIGPNKVWSVSD
jgi:hypothetical protein